MSVHWLVADNPVSGAWWKQDTPQSFPDDEILNQGDTASVRQENAASVCPVLSAPENIEIIISILHNAFRAVGDS